MNIINPIMCNIIYTSFLIYITICIIRLLYLYIYNYVYIDNFDKIDDYNYDSKHIIYYNIDDNMTFSFNWDIMIDFIRVGLMNLLILWIIWMSIIGIVILCVINNFRYDKIINKQLNKLNV